MERLILSPEQALAIWASRVRANRQQVDEYREVQDPSDFYGPIAAHFRDDPHRTDEPALQVLRSLVRPGETWLDVGAGGGRYALPLALEAGEVIAVDQSEGMLAVLRQGMQEYGISNIRVIQARWPLSEPPRADVAMIVHVGYDVEQIGPFLSAMEVAATRLCVAVLFQPQPTRAWDDLWPAVHGVERATLPALAEFLALLLARDRLFEVRLLERPVPSYESVEQAVEFARRQTWVQPGGEKDRRLQAAVAERLVERDGRYAFDWQPRAVGIVSWQPPG